jgi:hypothetical protein
MKGVLFFLVRVKYAIIRHLSNMMWRSFYSALRRRPDAAQKDSRFAREHFLIGQLDPAALQAVSNFLVNPTFVPLDPDDFDRGYRHNIGIDRKAWSEKFKYFDFGRDQIGALVPVIEQLTPLVTAAFGTPWRIVNLRAWTIQGRDEDFASNIWHTDGFNEAILKVLVYPGPIDAERGTTQVRLVDGSEKTLVAPPGAFLLFDPTLLVHRGIPPRSGERAVIELTFAASAEPDPTPVLAGLNAIYPWWPSYRPKAVARNCEAWFDCGQRAAPGAANRRHPFDQSHS